jgi:nucleotidyltransferase/DNA polymerase involved in DNA repair
LPFITHIKNSLRANAHESDDSTIRETVEEKAAQSSDPYHGVQEQLLAQEEELERMRRMQAEIFERLRSSRKVNPLPAEVARALRVLDLPPDASPDMIHQRYRQLAKTHHPDAGGDAETFKRINAAYKCIVTWISSQEQAGADISNRRKQ